MTGFWSAGRWVVTGLLPLLLCVAAVCDLRSRRIPNLLTGTVALFGVAACVLGWSAGSLASGLAASAAALAGGTLLHLLRVMGGGDIKLFAATALWLGLSGTGHAALATAVVGGILGIVFLRRGSARGSDVTGATSGTKSSRLAARLQLDEGHDADRVPYGVAIAAGSIWVWWELVVSRGGSI